jgi:hypothetical protein
VAVLTLGACGDDDDGSGEATTSDREPREQPAPAAEETAAPDDPLAQAETYAHEKFPEATETDDFLAAAVSGCYLGITGDYLGGPDNWSPDRRRGSSTPSRGCERSSTRPVASASRRFR